MEQAGQRAARQTGLDLARCLLREGRPLVGGVLLVLARDDTAGLGPLLATMQPSRAVR
jgi:hypothetical protein